MTTLRMRIACWINTATNIHTHTQYITHFIFHGASASVLRYSTFPVFFLYLFRKRRDVTSSVISQASFCTLKIVCLPKNDQSYKCTFVLMINVCYFN